MKGKYPAKLVRWARAGITLDVLPSLFHSQDGNNKFKVTGLPSDAKAISVQQWYRTVWVTFESDSFPLSPDNERLPEITLTCEKIEPGHAPVRVDRNIFIRGVGRLKKVCGR